MKPKKLIYENKHTKVLFYALVVFLKKVWMNKKNDIPFRNIELGNKTQPTKPC